MNSDIVSVIDRYLTVELAQYVTGIVLGEVGQDIPLNGSVALVEINGRKFGVTCYHILKEFWDLQSAGKDVAIQINRTNIDNLDNRIVDCSERLDLVTLDIEDIDTMQVSAGTAIGGRYFAVPHWPPQELQTGDRFGFVGFPGDAKFKNEKKIWLVACSITAQFVSDYSEYTILSEFQRETWRIVRGNIDMEIPESLGGFSGGPVFVFRNLTSGGILYPEFVGIVKEQSTIITDGVLMTRANRINVDGTIRND